MTRTTTSRRSGSDSSVSTIELFILALRRKNMHVIICLGKGWSHHDPNQEGLSAILSAIPDFSRIVVLRSKVDDGFDSIDLKGRIRKPRFEAWNDRNIDVPKWDYCIVMHPFPPGSVRSMTLARLFSNAGKNLLVCRSVSDCKGWGYRGLPKTS